MWCGSGFQYRNTDVGSSERPEKRRRRLKAHKALTGDKMNLLKQRTSKTTATTKEDDSTPLPLGPIPPSKNPVPTLADFTFLPPAPPLPKKLIQAPTRFYILT
ncbi:hypothetical protein K450DRAFT_263946 [Umbelopsis ramanniana AG]|uniref:Uncharacterized protein n=1 Tax=Umbelopsis ramanniana AG TaxID=1314678 RepID=A0AAD5HAB0_UMBRA|nr:uncharacterized protein K450DRAFT_263946 [Umbelopsis ramanniana AG]KAI8574968.1 hypothetical protein K450DRAFT_263946 [Umbelopsis ramanniana AG]